MRSVYTTHSSSIDLRSEIINQSQRSTLPLFCEKFQPWSFFFQKWTLSFRSWDAVTSDPFQGARAYCERKWRNKHKRRFHQQMKRKKEGYAPPTTFSYDASDARGKSLKDRMSFFYRNCYTNYGRRKSRFRSGRNQDWEQTLACLNSSTKFATFFFFQARDTQPASRTSSAERWWCLRSYRLIYNRSAEVKNFQYGNLAGFPVTLSVINRQATCSTNQVFEETEKHLQTSRARQSSHLTELKTVMCVRVLGCHFREYDCGVLVVFVYNEGNATFYCSSASVYSYNGVARWG